MESRTDERFGRTIENLNLSYLHAIRELAAIDPNEVRLRFGLPQDFAEHIRDAPVEVLHQLANPAIMLFKPRLPSTGISRALNVPGTVGRAMLFSQLLGD